MAKKQDLISQLEEKGVELTGEESVKELEALLEKSAGEKDGGAEKNVAPAKPAGSVKSDMSDMKVLTDTAAATKKILETEPKVSFIIPLMPGEKEGAYEIVNLNGYQVTIKKGVMVDIPRSIAEILANHYRITMSAGQDKLLGRSQDTDEALN